MPPLYQRNVDAAIAGVQSLFPFIHGNKELRLKGLTVGKAPDPDDKEAQKLARLNGEKWAVPLQGEFDLLNDGKVVDTGKLKLMNIPVPTDESTYIMARGEYHPFHQPRLKPGVYVRKKSTGDAEAQFNLSRGSNFSMSYNPEKQVYALHYRSTKAPLYHVLKALGASDNEMRQAWGEERWAANRKAPSRNKYLAKAAGVEDIETESQAAGVISDVFRAMEISTPEVPEKTLGYRTKMVGVPTLLLASKKVRAVQAGEEEPDNRESPEFKWMLDPSFFIQERTERSDIRKKLARRIHRHGTVREVFGGSSPLDPSVWAIFLSAGLADRAAQTNPVTTLLAMTRASVLGEGGIGSLNAITNEARDVQPGYMGIFDPVVTPEGSKTGVVYPLASGVEIRDREAWIPVIDAKTKKQLRLPYAKVSQGAMALTSEVAMAKTDKRPVRAIKGGKVIEIAPDKVDYLIRPSSTYSVPTRLIPFLTSVSANRAEIAARFMAQARIVNNNEAPLVQTVIPGAEESMERFLGSALLSKKAPSDGTVTKVDAGKIHIKGDDGVSRVVNYADMFPLNDGHSFQHDTILVKPGDVVKSGQTVSHSNSVKDGALALGVNARVAYMSDGGHNFEDAITISESFAKKLAVKTLVQQHYDNGQAEIGEKKYHEVIAPITADQRAKMENGVVKVGSVLKKGDLMIAAVRSTPLTKEEKLLAKTKADIVKMQDASIYWDKDFEGTVAEVTPTKDGVYVGVVVEEPARVGDKLATRAANKGVIGKCVPDHLMPRMEDGRHIEIMLNPTGVGNRMNSAQIYEALVGKVAEKQGAPIAVPQSPTEELGDPTSREVKVKQHERTYYVGPEKTPVKKVIKEYTYERDFVTMVQNILDEAGMKAEESLTLPDGTVVNDVIVGNSYIMRLMQLAEDKQSIRGHGHPYFYNVDRAPVKGSESLGDAEAESPQAIGRATIEALLVHGAVANIRDMANYKSSRDNDAVWTAIQEGSTLPPPVMPFVNRKFEAYLQGLGLRVERTADEVSLLPMTDDEVLKLSNGEFTKSTFFAAKSGKSKEGELFDAKITGGIDGEGFGHISLAEAMPNPMMIKPIAAVLGITQKAVREIASGQKFLYKTDKGFDVSDDAEGGLSLQKALKSIDVGEELKTEKDPKRSKYLRALQKLSTGASVYVNTVVPVVPPIFRQVSPTSKGEPMYADLNILYSDLISANNALKDLKADSPELLTEEEGRQLKGKVFESMQLLYGMAGPTAHNREAKGIMDQLHGPTSKYGMVQRDMLRRRQDLSARAVIVPGPELDVDEIGLPFGMALELYKPFVVRELGMTPLQAQVVIKDHPEDPAVRTALEHAMSKRPIWAKRDPVLHKFGIMAFYPVIYDAADNAVALHPLVMNGFNADTDGDTMAFHVPISDEAVKEAQNALPSRAFKSPAGGQYMMSPTLDAATGIFMLSRTPEGRQKLQEAIPEGLRGMLAKGKPDWDKKAFSAFNNELGSKHPEVYARTMDKLKDLGFKHMYETGFSFKLHDFDAQKAGRNTLLAEYNKRSRGMNNADKAALADKILAQADKDFVVPDTNNLGLLMRGAGKPSGGQAQQLLRSPMFAPWAGTTLPIYTGYGEGMGDMDYWSVAPQARKALVDKVTEVALPGTISKQMIAAALDQVITAKDCGATGAVSPIEDATDRVLSVPAGGFSAGVTITPELVQEFRKKGVQRVTVRTPLTCREPHGICAKCYGETEKGPAQLGDNVGIRAGQSLGEKATQLSLRSYHLGGFGTEAPAKQVASMLMLPENMPNKATITKQGGKVSYVKSTEDGWQVGVSNKERVLEHFVPKGRVITVDIGDTVKQAQALSDGTVDPRDVFKITNDLGQAQQALVDGIQRIYGKYGIHKKHAEVLVRSMTNLARVDEPGTSEYQKGDFVPYYAAQAWNRDNDGSMTVSPIIKGMSSLPQLKDEWAPALGYRNVRQLITDAAATGKTSKVHSLNYRSALLLKPTDFGGPRRGGRAEY